MGSFDGLENEADILNRFCQSDEKAFEIIFNFYWENLYVVALKGLRSSDDAEEIVQELFETLWKKRETLKILNLSAYLNSSVRRRIIDRIRSRIVQEKYWDYYKCFMPGFASEADEGFAVEELNSELENAIRQLPDKTQNVFRLNRLEGRPVSEIARDLKLSQRTIEYHLTKSARLIRLHLKDFILLLVLASF